jgi:hypothetical protein
LEGSGLIGMRHIICSFLALTRCEWWRNKPA